MLTILIDHLQTAIHNETRKRRQGSPRCIIVHPGHWNKVLDEWESGRIEGLISISYIDIENKQGVFYFMGIRIYRSLDIPEGIVNVCF